MDLCQRPSTEADLAQIYGWAMTIGAERYMSRYVPDSRRSVLWEIIIVDGVDAGTVWLMFGGGIGERAIKAVVAKLRLSNVRATIRLNVRTDNLRAIACYRKCDFLPMSVDEKSNARGELVSFITMELSIA
ncbi:GNAT family N-acetyltransferase [Paraburkholderia terrae]